MICIHCGKHKGEHRAVQDGLDFRVVIRICPTMVFEQKKRDERGA